MKNSEKIRKLSVSQKLKLLSGKDFWNTLGYEELGIKSIKVSDGPHGLRCQKDSADMIGINEAVPATCFPAGVTSAASWNRDLLKEEGAAIGKEALKNGVSVVLGPACNIKRNPLCGRNFEYFSEDPLVAGEMAAAYIEGMQETGAGSCLKHFALNSQEYKRMNSDSIADDRTMHEIYLAPFERAIRKAQPETIMCSYNRINGTYASDNKWLLNDTLRNEFGFKGLVMTDWGAMSDQIKGIKAGCDLLMPGGSNYMFKETLASIRSCELKEEELDKCVDRVIELASKERKFGEDVDYDKHHQLAKEIALEGAVLLKNSGALPLNFDDCAFFGHMAKEMRYQGAGSSHINPTKLKSVIEIKNNVPFEECVDKDGVVLYESLEKAIELAKRVKIPVIFAGLPDSYESEGFDRNDMKMPAGHLEMIEKIASVNPRTVVVLFGGSAMEVPFENTVDAILYMGIAGQACAEACLDLLGGEASPSGKLCESWPLRYEDVPSSSYYGSIDATYREGIYVGYRYFDKAGIEVRYPFGHGLSYSSFEYEDLKVSDNVATVTIRNTGDRIAKEVIEVYVRNPEGYRPFRELRGFEKIELLPGERKSVDIELDEHAFMIYESGWKKCGGLYYVEVGSSSRDIRLCQELDIGGENIGFKSSWYTKPIGAPSSADFEKLLGQPIPMCKKVGKGSFDMNSSLLDIRDHSLLARLVYEGVKYGVKKSLKTDDENDPTLKMMIICSTDLPLRSMVINSNGLFSENLAHMLLNMANGHIIKGLMCLLGGR